MGKSIISVRYQKERELVSVYRWANCCISKTQSSKDGVGLQHLCVLQDRRSFETMRKEGCKPFREHGGDLRTGWDRLNC